MPRAKPKRAVFICLCALILCGVCGAAYAADRAAAFDILNSWTCVRWGEDNIAWVVHYPENLVDPWVQSEAEKQKMRPEQMEELRKSFSEELRIGSATAVLLSVHAYGSAPINLSPMGKNIVLIDSFGKRVSPIAFEKKLDTPISGLVQGFVFFPLQTDKNFSIGIKGLIQNGETNFAFAGASRMEKAIITSSADGQGAPAVYGGEEQPGREVVVKIPTRKPNQPEKPAPPAPPEPQAIEEKGLGGSEVFLPSELAVPPGPKPVPEEPKPDETSKNTPSLPPKQLLEIYLKAWIDGDSDKMYSMLSSETQGRISKELFAREVTAGNFRSALRSGYKINWVGDSARVTVAKKILFVRTLETKQINFVTEDGSARVSW